ncbi:MAG TPA: hemerythrin domain-containing protein [Burkholderiaceae bacterium]|nr:hemerythrin domain-containing protein [Burkholderiaceae bacterium]
MNFSRQVSRTLDEEHRNNLELLGKVEQALARATKPDAALDGLLRQFAQALDHDIERHFRFEEESLFPKMEEAGDGDMAALLVEEHETIREVAAELLPLAGAAAEGTIDNEGWSALRRNALEMVERQVAHIQKETVALLPLLDDLLDDDTDRDLAFAYAEL